MAQKIDFSSRRIERPPPELIPQKRDRSNDLPKAQETIKSLWQRSAVSLNPIFTTSYSLARSAAPFSNQDVIYR